MKKTTKTAKSKTIGQQIGYEIDKELSKEKKTSTCGKDWNCHSGNGAYFLGFLGAAVYYISTATGFWNGVLGFLKAIVWPAFLVYEVLKYLGA